MTSEPQRWQPIGGGMYVDMSKMRNSEYNHARVCRANELRGQQCLRCYYE